MNSVFHTFVMAVRSAFEAGKKAGDALAEELDQFILLIDDLGLYSTDRNKTASTDFELNHLTRALSLAEKEVTAPLAEALWPIVKLIEWSSGYQEDDITEGFLGSVATAEVISPIGPVVNKDLIIGLSLIAPNTFYPYHGHQAVEVYHIISGSPQFKVAENPWVQLVPGSFSLHDADVGHAIKANGEPILTLFGWRGNLQAPTWFLVDSETGNCEKRFTTRIDSTISE